MMQRFRREVESSIIPIHTLPTHNMSCVEAFMIANLYRHLPQVVRNVWVGVTPAMLAVHGELEAVHSISVAGRDGKVYNIK